MTYHDETVLSFVVWASTAGLDQGWWVALHTPPNAKLRHLDRMWNWTQRQSYVLKYVMEYCTLITDCNNSLIHNNCTSVKIQLHTITVVLLQ